MTDTETLPRESGAADAASWTAHEPEAGPAVPAASGRTDGPPPAAAGPPGTEPSGPGPRLPRELVLRALI